MATDDGSDAQLNATFVHCTPYEPALRVRGINERLKIPRLTELLREMFGEYGTIVDVVAKKNLKAKGQAFVVYDSEESAQEAIEDLQGFDLDGHPMTLAFARSRSDATVLREDGEAGLESHKRHRIAEKERKQAVAAAAEAAQNANKRNAPNESNNLASRPAKVPKSSAVDPSSTNTSAIPDEYLPPNKILFVREVPTGTPKEALAAIFSRFAGYKEVRTVPGRANIAFVEYEGEEGAIAAKEATAGMVVGADEGSGGKAIRVTFQRK